MTAISMTTRSVARYIDDAERLLEAARRAATMNEAFVHSYRAALRAAGALIDLSMVGRRRKPSGTAWEKVERLRPELGQWTQYLARYGRTASRCDMGLDIEVSAEQAQAMYADACTFLDFVRAEISGVPHAA